MKHFTEVNEPDIVKDIYKNWAPNFAIDTSKPLKLEISEFVASAVNEYLTGDHTTCSMESDLHFVVSNGSIGDEKLEYFRFDIFGFLDEEVNYILDCGDDAIISNVKGKISAILEKLNAKTT